MKKLLIVDGHCLLFQSFYGMQNKLLTKDGMRIETVICFIGLLRKTIELIKPTHIFIVFDGETALSRQNILPEYKANRQDFSNIDNPFDQLEIIKKVLVEYDISFFETTNCEADDYIAGIVKSLSPKINVVISSHDKDFFQLINKSVSVLSYRGKSSILWTENKFKEYYNFSPEKFALYKSLVGDKSDNITGIKGIGKITATKLINCYKDIQTIVANYKCIQTPEEEMLRKLLLNYNVISLDSSLKHDLDINNCQIEFDINKFTYRNVFNKLNLEF